MLACLRRGFGLVRALSLVLRATFDLTFGFALTVFAFAAYFKVVDTVVWNAVHGIQQAFSK